MGDELPLRPLWPLFGAPMATIGCHYGCSTMGEPGRGPLVGGVVPIVDALICETSSVSDGGNLCRLSCRRRKKCE